MKRPVFILLTFSWLMSTGHGQELSNKGNDFWVGYGSHCYMYNATGGSSLSGGPQNLVLYFTSDVDAVITVTIPLTGWKRTYLLKANTVVESDPIPKIGPDDVRLITEGKLVQRGIHITSNEPIVAYAHIYRDNISGATLLFPTSTLGSEYYSLNYTQSSNEPYSYPFCFVIATEDSTIVEITPSANTLTHAAGITFTDTLMKGDVYNLLGKIDPVTYSGVDLTGTKIKSISNLTGQCKRVAVFSGSGKIDIKCMGVVAASADNYIQQVFPLNCWGQKYLTVPTANMPFNYFRVLVRDISTIVKVNGAIQTGLQNNSFYDLPLTDQPVLIEADRPVLVAQYITSTKQCGNNFINTNGDPEVIYLNPIDNTLNAVTLNSTAHNNITEHWINIVIKTGAVNSFRLDGRFPSTTFRRYLLDSTYSYAQIEVSKGQHTLTADSGFNVMAYGFGEFESYGYNAGFNVKNYQYINTAPDNPVNPHVECSGIPFNFYITLPFEPTSLYWDFQGAQTNIMQQNPREDSTYFFSGRRLWRYKTPVSFTYKAGSYPVKVIAENPALEDCNAKQQIDFNLNVIKSPVADFNFQNNCSNTIVFRDSSNLGGAIGYKWFWDFGDGSFQFTKDTNHTYDTTGRYATRHYLITEQGCSSDTVTKLINVNLMPKPDFIIKNAGKLCALNEVQIQNNSTIASGKITRVEIYWDSKANPSDLVVDDNPDPNKLYKHVYANFSNPSFKIFELKLRVFSGESCTSEITRSITINASPLVSIDPVTDVCFTGTPVQLIAKEINGIAGNGVFSGTGISTAGLFNPAIAGIGVHPIKYTFTSVNGCIASKERIVKVVGATVNAGPDRVVVKGNSITLEPRTMEPVLLYRWTPNVYLSNNAIRNPIVVGVADQTYTLTVTTITGCPASDQVEVKVLQPLFIPNAFTPNGDGLNDKWVIRYLDTYPDNRVQVFNRYGQVVFESRGYAQPWDGKKNGKDLPSGAYYYIIEPGNGLTRLVNYVIIVR